MSFLKTLLDAETEPISAYHQFLLSKKRHCTFFEGPDDPSFYKNFLLHYVTEESLDTFRCDNKKDVYETRELVSEYLSKTPQRAAKVVVMFFVDKDYSDLIDIDGYTSFPEVYVTDFHSIENHIISGSTFGRLLEEVFHFKGNRKIDFERLRTKFETELQTFYQRMIPITAWVICMVRRGEKPYYDNYRINKVFCFDGDMNIVDCLSDYKDHNHALEDMCKVVMIAEDQANIQAIIDELKTLEPRKFVRGKYVMGFFLEYLKELNKFFGQNLKGVAIAMHPRIDNEKDAVRVLGPRTIMPSSLKQFIEINLANQPSFQNVKITDKLL